MPPRARIHTLTRSIHTKQHHESIHNHSHLASPPFTIPHLRFLTFPICSPSQKRHTPAHSDRALIPPSRPTNGITPEPPRGQRRLMPSSSSHSHNSSSINGHHHSPIPTLRHGLRISNAILVPSSVRPFGPHRQTFSQPTQPSRRIFQLLILPRRCRSPDDRSIDEIVVDSLYLSFTNSHNTHILRRAPVRWNSMVVYDDDDYDEEHNVCLLSSSSGFSHFSLSLSLLLPPLFFYPFVTEQREPLSTSYITQLLKIQRIPLIGKDDETCTQRNGKRRRNHYIRRVYVITMTSLHRSLSPLDNDAYTHSLASVMMIDLLSDIF